MATTGLSSGWQFMNARFPFMRCSMSYFDQMAPVKNIDSRIQPVVKFAPDQIVGTIR
jgi:hypothetical protein